jgi:hypothetical protein
MSTYAHTPTKLTQPCAIVAHLGTNDFHQRTTEFIVRGSILGPKWAVVKDIVKGIMQIGWLIWMIVLGTDVLGERL